MNTVQLIGNLARAVELRAEAGAQGVGAEGRVTRYLTYLDRTFRDEVRRKQARLLMVTEAEEELPATGPGEGAKRPPTPWRESLEPGAGVGVGVGVDVGGGDGEGDGGGVGVGGDVGVGAADFTPSLRPEGPRVGQSTFLGRPPRTPRGWTRTSDVSISPTPVVGGESQRGLMETEKCGEAVKQPLERHGVAGMRRRRAWDGGGGGGCASAPAGRRAKVTRRGGSESRRARGSAPSVTAERGQGQEP